MIKGRTGRLGAIALLVFGVAVLLIAFGFQP
jgi:hypothetical protein